MQSQLPNPPQAIVKTQPAPTNNTHTTPGSTNALGLMPCWRRSAPPSRVFFARRSPRRVAFEGRWFAPSPLQRVCVCDIFPSEVMSFKDGPPAASPLARVAANPLRQPQLLAASFLFFQGSSSKSHDWASELRDNLVSTEMFCFCFFFSFVFFCHQSPLFQTHTGHVGGEVHHLRRSSRGFPDEGAAPARRALCVHSAAFKGPV